MTQEPRPDVTRLEAVARWLHMTFSRWPTGGDAAAAWRALSEKSKTKWRHEARDLLGLLGLDPDG